MHREKMSVSFYSQSGDFFTETLVYRKNTYHFFTMVLYRGPLYSLNLPLTLKTNTVATVNTLSMHKGAIQSLQLYTDLLL